MSGQTDSSGETIGVRKSSLRRQELAFLMMRSMSAPNLEDEYADLLNLAFRILADLQAQEAS